MRKIRENPDQNTNTILIEGNANHIAYKIPTENHFHFVKTYRITISRLGVHYMSFFPPYFLVNFGSIFLKCYLELKG